MDTIEILRTSKTSYDVIGVPTYWLFGFRLQGKRTIRMGRIIYDEVDEGYIFTPVATLCSMEEPLLQRITKKILELNRNI
jgi:hypothetical protein